MSRPACVWCLRPAIPRAIIPANATWDFSTAAFSERLASDGLDVIGTYPEWMPRLREWGVKRALFSHDLLVWHRDNNDLGRPQPA